MRTRRTRTGDMGGWVGNCRITVIDVFSYPWRGMSGGVVWIIETMWGWARGVNVGFSLPRFTMSSVTFPVCTSLVIIVEGVRDGMVGWDSTGVRRGHMRRQMGRMSGMRTRIFVGIHTPR